MPSSQYHQINEITELIHHSRADRVLDVGIGFGKYGFLCREYLELNDGRETYGDWRKRIDGVEGFPEYVLPLHRAIYNEIYVGNALEVLPTLSLRYDLLLLIDVLEHFDHGPGVKLLDLCRARARNVIVSTPLDIGEQGGCFGNELERHRFQWRRQHLDMFPHRFFVPNRYSMICFAGEDAPVVRVRCRQDRRRAFVDRYCPWLKRPYAAARRALGGFGGRAPRA